MASPGFWKEQPPPLSDAAQCALKTGLDCGDAGNTPAKLPATSTAGPRPRAAGSAAPSQPLATTPAAPRGPPAWFGFRDEYSIGVTEFLRRAGLGRTKVYELIEAREIDSFLLDGKRMILIESWIQYVVRRQEAERSGQLGKRPGRTDRRSPDQPEALY